MLNIIHSIFKKRYLITDETLDKIVDIAEEEIRSEVEREIKDIENDILKKYKKLEKEHEELEKNYNKIVVEKDILKAKLDEINQDDSLFQSDKYTKLKKDLFED